MSNDPFAPPVRDTSVVPPVKEAAETDMLTYIFKAIVVIVFAMGLGWVIAHILGLSWGWIPIEC